jgi:dTDP-6-deoxy-L-talose 4-dehydrogenase (NAD+)
MELLVTGATGFIGKRVVNFAIEQGHKIAILTSSLKEAKEMFGSSVSIIYLNDFLSGAVKINCKKVIHLGWSNVQNYMDKQNLQENLSAQFDLLDKLVKAGVNDITVTGTCLEYGMVEGACKEDMLVKEPLTMPYAQAKYELYKHLAQNKNINLKWLRCFYVYGLGQRANSLLSTLLAAIENGEQQFNMSGGQQKRDFIHVDTLAQNILAVALQDKVSGIINAGSGISTTALQFVEKILAIKNYEMKLNLGYYPYSNYEPMEFWADSTKLKSVEGTVFDKEIWL